MQQIISFLHEIIFFIAKHKILTIRTFGLLNFFFFLWELLCSFLISCMAFPSYINTIDVSNKGPFFCKHRTLVLVHLKGEKKNNTNSKAALVWIILGYCQKSSHLRMSYSTTVQDRGSLLLHAWVFSYFGKRWL